MTYNNLDPRKQAFIFELDNVLYPEKDYLYQVYYLFAAMMEYTELLDAQALVKLMTQTYQEQGNDAVFDGLRQKFKFDEKYRINFSSLMNTAKLPLKLLLFQNMLALLQEIVVDRKKIFLVTNGNVQRQLNKIKQVEWHHLDPYLTCYFAWETVPKPEPDVIHLLMKEHHLQRRDLLMIGATETDMLCAEACGIDYTAVENFI